MSTNNDQEFEFNITFVGTGEDVDSAFQDVLDNLAIDPMSVMVGEVVYVAKSKVEVEEIEEVEESTFDN